MATIGGNIEKKERKKEIGLSIGVSGTLDKTTGYLQLFNVDGQGNPVYVEQGSWTSDVIDLGDIFQEFENVFIDNTVNGASSFALLTRVSDNGVNWSDWIVIAEDGAIQSETKKYIQVRIDLFAGFVTDEFIISKSDFNTNEYIEEKESKTSKYIAPTLTSNTSSPLGFAFSSSVLSASYATWMAFDKVDSNYFYTANGVIDGFLGFYFKERRRVTKLLCLNHGFYKEVLTLQMVLMVIGII